MEKERISFSTEKRNPSKRKEEHSQANISNGSHSGLNGCFNSINLIGAAYAARWEEAKISGH